MDVRVFLETHDPVIADGGMGTMLFSAGLPHGIAPELWNVEAPEKIRAVHQGYVDAGAQIILTNSFGGNRLRLEMHELGDRVAELNGAAARIARDVADHALHSVLVAGSMGPTGALMEPYGTLSPEEAVSVFAEQAKALIENSVDLLWIETMADVNEVEAAIQAIRSIQPHFPIAATMTFDTHGHTMMGVSPEQAIERFAGLNLVLIGANCGNGPDELEAVIHKMHAAQPQVRLIAKANAGMPHLEDDIAVYDAAPADMALYARRVHQHGARVIGACCGSTPAHIKAIAAAFKG